MISRRTKSEVSTMIFKKDMKGKAKSYKILVLSHPFGAVRDNAQVSSMLDRKHIVDFLLVTIELFR